MIMVKLLFLVIAVQTMGNSQHLDTVMDFDYRLSNIVVRFKEIVMDEYECKSLLSIVSVFREDIDHVLQFTDQYRQMEIIKLKRLQIEAQAIEEFIACVGHCANYTPDIESFKLANNRINGEIIINSQNKFCIDIVSVSIGSYVACLAINYSTDNLQFTYELVDSTGNLVGMGKSGLWHNCIRCIHDNRNDLKPSHIYIKEITCKTI
jgi:hypothetical protein